MSARGIARVGMLAVGLSTGAAVAAVAGSASADSSTNWLSAIDTLLGGVSAPVAGASSGLNFAISIDGATLFQIGTAAAHSGTDGDIAVASGENATAYAYGSNDYAAVAGTDSTAWSGGLDPAGAVGSKLDLALIIGNNDTALAGGEGGNPGTFDYSLIFGNGNGAYAGGNATGPGNYDVAYVEGNDLGTARAQGGDHLVDVLKFYGAASTAGAADSGHVVGDLLPSTGATAEGGNFLTDLVALFDPGAAAADSGHFLADLASLF